MECVALEEVRRVRCGLPRLKGGVMIQVSGVSKKRQKKETIMKNRK